MENIKVHCNRCRSSKLGHNDFEMNLKTNEYCKSCIKCREYDKQFKIKNRDKIRAQAREHYQEVKEIVAERGKQWREKIKTDEKKYQNVNAEEIINDDRNGDMLKQKNILITLKIVKGSCIYVKKSIKSSFLVLLKNVLLKLQKILIISFDSV